MNGGPKTSSVRMEQVRWWMLTIPQSEFMPYLPPGITYCKGQLETAATGFAHWQLCVSFDRSQRLAAVKKTFGTKAHCEPIRNIEQSLAYVWKVETAIEGTRFIMI